MIKIKVTTLSNFYYNLLRFMKYFCMNLIKFMKWYKLLTL